MTAADRALARALLQRAGPGAVLLRHDRQPWASLTFEGQRHLLAVALAAGAVDGFAEALEEWEVALPGHILADLAVDERAEAEDGRTTVLLAALTLAAA